MRELILATAAFVLLSFATASAQQSQRYPMQGQSGNFVPGVLGNMCLDARGNAVSTSAGTCAGGIAGAPPVSIVGANPLWVRHCRPNPLTGVTAALC
jgi:outer membrane lipoprotein SlyB